MSTVDDTFAVDEDAVFFHFFDGFLVIFDAAAAFVVVVIGRGRHEGDSAVCDGVGCVVDVVASDGDMLDSFSFVFFEEFLDLALVVGAFVEGDADFAAWGGERAGG